MGETRKECKRTLVDNPGVQFYCDWRTDDLAQEAARISGIALSLAVLQLWRVLWAGHLDRKF